MPIKIKLSFILALLLCISLSGQTAAQSSENHGITVIDKKWKFVKKVVTVNFSVQQDQQRILQAAPGAGITNDDIGKTATVTYYLYGATFKNHGQKSIKEIMWDYVFFDPLTKKEINRHHFVSRKIIRPGGKKTIVGESNLPPSNIIDANAVNRNYAAQYTEEIHIKNVKYSDGSTWEETTQKP